MKNPASKTRKHFWLIALAGFLIGCLLLMAIRFITYSEPHHVHHHANFALYVNGQRDLFDNFTFYEEVQACNADEQDNPKARVHMHDKKNHVVHVHAHAVTWGAFFANLGYALGDTALTTDNGTFVDGQDGKELRFILNGQPTEAIANKLINSKDRLLIDYGNESAETIQQRYEATPNDAQVYNMKPDPAACSGAHQPSFTERFKNIF